MNGTTRFNIHICLITGARIFDLQLGGEGKFSKAFGRWLAGNKYSVTLIGSTFTGVRAKYLSAENNRELSESNHKSELSKKKPAVIYPPFFVYTASRLVISLMALVKIINIHRDRSITIIHAQDTGYSGLAAILAGKILSIPVVISSHGIRHQVIASQNKGQLNAILIKIEYKLDLYCIKNSNGVITVNPYIKKYFEDRVPDSQSKIRIIPNPIRVSEFGFSYQHREEIREEFGISSGTIFLGFVGRLVGVKNLITLIEAFAEALRTIPSLSLLLVGTGAQEAELKNLVKSKGLENKVFFSGTRTDIARIMSAIDIFVLPSFSEGLSTSLLEAMASGRAVICSDIPANRQLITHDENGTIINPSNREELRDAIVKLAADAGLRMRVGKAAQETARKYDEGNVFHLIEKYYGDILDAYKS